MSIFLRKEGGDWDWGDDQGDIALFVIFSVFACSIIEIGKNQRQLKCQEVWNGYINNNTCIKWNVILPVITYSEKINNHGKNVYCIILSEKYRVQHCIYNMISNIIYLTDRLLWHWSYFQFFIIKRNSVTNVLGSASFVYHTVILIGT